MLHHESVLKAHDTPVSDFCPVARLVGMVGHVAVFDAFSGGFALP